MLHTFIRKYQQKKSNLGNFRNCMFDCRNYLHPAVRRENVGVILGAYKKY